MILVATLLGISIDSLIRINSSLAESIGLFASLTILLIVCALVFWKGKNKLTKQLSTHVLVPTVLASYLWLDAFVM